MLVAVVASRAALGGLEAARLLVAPAILLVGGVGTFLLPTLTVLDKRDPADVERRVRSLCALLGAGTAAVGLVAVVFARPLGHALTGGHIAVRPLGVAAWAAFATTFATTMPWDGLGAVRRAARQVFLVRVVEGVAALALAAILLVPLDLPVEVAPFGLSAAGLLALFVLRRVTTRGPNATMGALS
jgi:O-antigen/teichoic acid export membrane protein